MTMAFRLSFGFCVWRDLKLNPPKMEPTKFDLVNNGDYLSISSYLSQALDHIGVVTLI